QECDPAAECERRLERHIADAHREIGARKVEAHHIGRLRHAFSSERVLDRGPLHRRLLRAGMRAGRGDEKQTGGEWPRDSSQHGASVGTCCWIQVVAIASSASAKLSTSACVVYR